MKTPTEMAGAYEAMSPIQKKLNADRVAPLSEEIVKRRARENIGSHIVSSENFSARAISQDRNDEAEIER